MTYQEQFEKKIREIKEEGRYRVFAEIDRQVGIFPRANYCDSSGIEKEITIWCSNDYLGMGQSPVVLQAMSDAVYRSGAGAGGTRNISGTSPRHRLLEKSVADLHKKESALVFTSGYVANVGALGAIAGLLDDCVIFSDALNHASMIHGMRTSKKEKKIFPHNCIDTLYKLLKNTDKKRNKIIAFESVYSM